MRIPIYIYRVRADFSSIGRQNIKIILAVLAFITSLFIQSCSIISTFDEGSLNKSYQISEDIQVLYYLMSDTDSDKRHYSEFRRDYARITVALQSLLDRQKARKKNSESIKITEQILTFFEKYKHAHESTNQYKNAKLKIHSKRLNSLMDALIKAEEVKRR